MIRKPLITATAIILLVAGTMRGQQSPVPEPSPSPQTYPLPEPTPLSITSPSPTPTPAVLGNLEDALRRNEATEQSEAPADPNKPRMHRYTDQPIGTVLRVLAEQAGMNYVEPNLNPDERISIYLSAMTPIQAFYAVAATRGFKVVYMRNANTMTLERSDVKAPSYFEQREFKIRYQPAEDIKQAIAGWLGIQVKPVAQNNPSYPAVANTLGGAGGASGTEGSGGTNGGNNNGSSGSIQPLYQSGTQQSVPRFISGIPFDNPLSTSRNTSPNDQERRVWTERSSNSVMVFATHEELQVLAAQVAAWDHPENQIQLNTYVVEVNTNDDLFGGVDWSNTLGQNGATFSLSGNVGTPPNTIFSAPFGGAFFKSGLILTLPTVQATIRALTQRGKLLSTNSPVTYTRTGEPVQIRSTTDQTIFLQTAATANVQATTTPYVFTSGLTIDVVPRILANGIIDLKINPTLSTPTGQSAAQPGTSTTVPIISTRSVTADVMVRSGDAAVIGGITQDTNNNLINGIPGLRKIPLLGYLFSTRQQNRDRTNLIIVVWPQIIPGTFTRADRYGTNEAESVNDLQDLPGEPPPLASRRDDKQPVRQRSGKATVNFVQAGGKPSKPHRTPPPQ
jgi:type II secretory pathway component GspD/PulD (secretin)